MMGSPLAKARQKEKNLFVQGYGIAAMLMARTANPAKAGGE